MNINKLIGAVPVLAFPLFLGACGISKKYEQPQLSKNIQDSLYRTELPADSQSMATVPWRDVFHDPNLIALIDAALANNLDYKNTILQIAQAEALYKQSKLAFFPSVSFAPQVSYNHTSQEALNFPPGVNIRLNTTTVQLGFTTNWELDIWGKLASAKRASAASWYQTQAAKHAMETALIATVASNYYTLLALDEQLAITEKTIELRRKSLNTISKLKEAAVLTGAAVVQAEANLYAAEVSLPDLHQSIRELENSLSNLTAQPSRAIKRSTLKDAMLHPEIALGVPVALLRNRPDVLAAELNYRRAFEQTNVAKAQFYPTVALTSGGIGISALTHNNLFAGSSAIFYNLVGGITQPIFQRGAIKSNYKVAQLQQEQALNSFQKAILTAGQEVSNALYAIEVSKSKQQTRQKQITALEKAVNFNMQLLEYSSTTNYTDVLTSEQSLLSAQLAGINDLLQQNRATIELYRALGGGWQ
jgi:multidrug efflux system outer membrane protein